MSKESYPSYTSEFPELGFYAFPGSTRDTRSALQHIATAEELGIGNVMISERTDYKDIGVLCGAAAATTNSIYISSSATNPNTRHPAYLASMCSSINRMSQGRFALGLGKGIARQWKAIGLKPNTYAREKEYVELLRRLWRGETIENYSGAIGEYTRLALQGSYVDEDIPCIFVGFGPTSLKHAGTLYDGVHLHPFMTEYALDQSLTLIKQGSREAGRSDDAVTTWAIVVTACNISDERYLKDIISRLATYLQAPGYGDTLAKINGWSREAIADFRNDPLISSMKGLIDAVATPQQLEKIERLIPEDWRATASGSAADCARYWVKQLEAGADGVIIHGCTPEEFEPVLEEYRKIRPSHLFHGRTNRPA